MSSGPSRIYVFRGPDDSTPEQGTDPFRKLKIIVGIIAGLYIIDLMLVGTQNMIARFIENLLFIPIILFSLTFHEFAHAAMADFLGDSTARRLGRLSLDPRRHLDFFGTLLLFFANFGWAKPVPVDPDNFRVKDRAMMSVALAGPASNVFLAVMGGVMLRLYAMSAGLPLSRALFESYFGVFCLYMITINLGLAAFNLIPLPPLDGSKVLSYFLSPRQRIQYRSIEELGPLLLILIVSFGLVGQVIGPVVRSGTELIIKFFF